jgi:hypothetical protein
MRIESIQVGHYLIPLPVMLTDATHGEMTCFAVVTVRIRCATGEEEVGYTYTVLRSRTDTLPLQTGPVTEWNSIGMRWNPIA